MLDIAPGRAARGLPMWIISADRGSLDPGFPGTGRKSDGPRLRDGGAVSAIMGVWIALVFETPV